MSNKSELYKLDRVGKDSSGNISFLWSKHQLLCINIHSKRTEQETDRIKVESNQNTGMFQLKHCYNSQSHTSIVVALILMSALGKAGQ